MVQPIRDIRADLRVRLDLIGPRRDKAQARYEAELHEIAQEETMLKTLLAAEERFMATARVVVQREWAGNPLENEILDLLGNEDPWEHGEIKTALIERGYGKDDEARFGQSLQGTLLSMAHRDLVVSAGHSTWQITEFGSTGAVKKERRF
jgi:hypothetical protein